MLDTRLCNCSFVEPWHTALPTPAAWASLEIGEDDALYLADVDVDNAFYRIKNPPGLEEMFTTPPVYINELRACGVDIPSELEGSLELSPILLVLPMGFSWSLYFGQRMVEESALAGGALPGDFVVDRRVPPEVRGGKPWVGVYVDGAAAVGTDLEAVDGRVLGISLALNGNNLLCHEVVAAGGVQEFAGLSFDKDSGRISVKPKRLWRLRLALLRILEVGRISGVALQAILGHVTWCALVRRPLLSLSWSC